MFKDTDGVANWLGLTAGEKPTYVIKTKIDNNDILTMTGDAGDTFAIVNSPKGVQILCNMAH